MPKPVTLTDLVARHQGKILDKWSSYLRIYDELFAPMRDAPVRMLEIGVHNGGSLELWAKYFSSAAEIIGCEIDPERAQLTFSSPNIRLVIGDACQASTAEEVVKNGSGLNLVIDDGSHRPGEIAASFSRYFRHLKPGGLYVVEDLHCSYWRDFDGELESPFSSISFLKLLVDVVHFDHWHLDAQRSDVLGKIARRFGIEFSNADLAEISSLHFHDSLCIIRKSDGDRGVGRRLVVGDEGTSFNLALPEAIEGGDYSSLALLPETWLDRVRDRDARIEALEKSLEEQRRDSDARVNALENSVSNLEYSVSDLEKSLKEIRASTSWRVTAPLRGLRSLFR